MRLSDAQKMYEADHNAIHVAGIPSLQLMQTAADHLSRAAEEIMGENRSAAIFCGSGNNGGDGIAAGANLLRRGATVRLFLVGSREKLTADSRAMLAGLEAIGGALEDFDPEDESILPLLRDQGVIVDAMFGIGIIFISTMVAEVWRMLRLGVSQLTRRVSFATCENVRTTF